MGGCYQFALLRNPEAGNVTPDGFLEIFNEGASFYVQALFALADREIGTIEGFSPDLMYSFFNFVVKNREQLCDDIERGDIRRYPELPEHIRLKLSAQMHADPARARELHSILGGTSKGMARRMWPDLQFVMVASSGGFANSHSLLANSYLEGIPTGFMIYAGSEGMYGK